MYYLDLFRPIFSLAAHSRCAVRPDGSPPEETVAGALEAALTAAWRAGRSCGSGSFREAWHALLAWLCEILPEAHLPDGISPAEFSGTTLDRLENLLGRPVMDCSDRDFAAVLEVYDACFALGLTGGPRTQEEQTRAENLRRRCREILIENAAVPAAFDQVFADQNTDFPARRRYIFPAALWIASPAAVLGLFALYRHFLAGIAADAAG